MDRQDNYLQTKYSDPEFQPSPILFNKSTWIAAAEDSVSHTQAGGKTSGCEHTAAGLTHNYFIKFIGKSCFHTKNLMS